MASSTNKFQEYLQELADRRKLCSIRFRTVEGSVSEIRAHITEVMERGGRWMIETDAGFGIGVDQILEIDGRAPAHFC